MMIDDNYLENPDTINVVVRFTSERELANQTISPSMQPLARLPVAARDGVIGTAGHSTQT